MTSEDAPWERWFAWYPVEIDAYNQSEIKDGKLRYRVHLRWVERRFVKRIISDPGDNLETWSGWEYRLLH